MNILSERKTVVFISLQYIYKTATKYSCICLGKAYNIIDRKNNGTKRKTNFEAQIKAKGYDV